MVEKLSAPSVASGSPATPPVSGRVRFADLQGASVYIDGSRFGEIPMEVPLAPGRHKIVFRRVGEADCVKWLTVVSGIYTQNDDCFPHQ